jgi:hypothetical protein
MNVVQRAAISKLQLGVVLQGQLSAAVMFSTVCCLGGCLLFLPSAELPARMKTVLNLMQAALLSMDDSSLSVEQLSALSRAVPDDSERKEIGLFLAGQHPKFKWVSLLACTRTAAWFAGCFGCLQRGVPKSCSLGLLLVCKGRPRLCLCLLLPPQALNSACCRNATSLLQVSTLLPTAAAEFLLVTHLSQHGPCTLWSALAASAAEPLWSLGHPLLQLLLYHCRRGISNVERLGTVERYFVEIKDIPRLRERIKCFMFVRTYAATKAKVCGQATVLRRGLSWVLISAGWCCASWSVPSGDVQASMADQGGSCLHTPLLCCPAETTPANGTLLYALPGRQTAHVIFPVPLLSLGMQWPLRCQIVRPLARCALTRRAPALPAALQLEEHLDIMKAASAELHDCPPFMKVLQAVLALGNHLNEVRGWEKCCDGWGMHCGGMVMRLCV